MRIWQRLCYCCCVLCEGGLFLFNSYVPPFYVNSLVTLPRTRLLHWDSEDKQLVCVCMYARMYVEVGGLLYSCIDWEPMILPQASPTKDAWKSHKDVLPPLQMCDSPMADFEATFTSTTLMVSDRQTDTM